MSTVQVHSTRYRYLVPGLVTNAQTCSDALPGIMLTQRLYTGLLAFFVFFTRITILYELFSLHVIEKASLSGSPIQAKMFPRTDIPKNGK